MRKEVVGIALWLEEKERERLHVRREEESVWVMKAVPTLFYLEEGSQPFLLQKHLRATQKVVKRVLKRDCTFTFTRKTFSDDGDDCCIAGNCTASNVLNWNASFYSSNGPLRCYSNGWF